MDTVEFGLSAPIALDALLMSGDELLVAFIVIGSVYLISARRSIATGALLAAFMITPLHLLSASGNGDLVLVALAAIVFVIATTWLLDRSPVRHRTMASTYASFAVSTLVGLELLNELMMLTARYPSTLPVWLGLVAAVVNVIGLGCLIAKMIYDAPGFPRLTEPVLRKLSASMLIGFSIYCVGSTSGLNWPGDELVIAVFAAIAYGCAAALRPTRSL